MNRYEDTCNLFGVGIGSGSCGEETCDICGAVHNEGCTTEETLSEDSVTWADFGDIHVCECCFGRIEAAVLSRIDDILPWYGRILAAKRAELERREKAAQPFLTEEPR